MHQRRRTRRVSFQLTDSDASLSDRRRSSLVVTSSPPGPHVDSKSLVSWSEDIHEAWKSLYAGDILHAHRIASRVLESTEAKLSLRETAREESEKVSEEPTEDAELSITHIRAVLAAARANSLLGGIGVERTQSRRGEGDTHQSSDTLSSGSSSRSFPLSLRLYSRAVDTCVEEQISSSSLISECLLLRASALVEHSLSLQSLEKDKSIGKIPAPASAPISLGSSDRSFSSIHSPQDMFRLAISDLTVFLSQYSILSDAWAHKSTGSAPPSDPARIALDRIVLISPRSRYAALSSDATSSPSSSLSISSPAGHPGRELLSSLTANALFLLALAFMHVHRFHDSLSALISLIELSSPCSLLPLITVVDEYSVHHLHGSVLSLLGRCDEAVKALSRAISLDPPSRILGQLLFERAEAYANDGKVYEAMEDFRRAETHLLRVLSSSENSNQ